MCSVAQQSDVSMTRWVCGLVLHALAASNLHNVCTVACYIAPKQPPQAKHRSFCFY